jgi:retron-type reverse transcriptase
VHIPKANGQDTADWNTEIAGPSGTDSGGTTTAACLWPDFHENSDAYRPRKRVQQAIDAIKEALLSGRREVVDADLSGYFDTIPHAELMRLVKGRGSDGSILRLIKGWLRAPVVEEDPKGGRRRD